MVSLCKLSLSDWALLLLLLLPLQSNAELVELWLGRNRISKIEHLEHLVHLQRMSLQSNRCVSLTACLRTASILAALGLAGSGAQHSMAAARFFDVV
jgi:Leucine-rich repeat (LRR) protein